MRPQRDFTARIRRPPRRPPPPGTPRTSEYRLTCGVVSEAVDGTGAARSRRRFHARRASSSPCGCSSEGLRAEYTPLPYDGLTAPVTTVVKTLYLPFGVNSGFGDVKPELEGIHPFWNAKPYRPFTAQFTGKLAIPESGNYRFLVSHDDAMTMRVDGRIVHSAGSWTGGPSSQVWNSAGPVYLAKGRCVPIEIVLTQNPPTNNHLWVMWESDAGVPLGQIPVKNMCADPF